MMGIPCEGPTYMYGDNQSALANTTIPDSTLKKKSQNLLTKFLPDGGKRKQFLRCLLYHIYNVDAVDAKMNMAQCHNH
eukprot:15349851-Ditylum_brightwellii.AAC.1